MHFKNKKIIFLIVGVVLLLVVLAVLFSSKRKQKIAETPITTQTTSTTLPATSTVTPAPQTAGTTILTRTTFTQSPNNWYQHVWYKKADSGGEVTFSANGVTFQAIASNSRSGLMIDINKDVTAFTSVVVNAVITASKQTLAGTGYNGREAPVAIAVSYTDVNGLNHNQLSEDPKNAANMFWRGFYYLSPADTSATVNGIKVEKGMPYSFSFDLMTLQPKPATIHFVGIEGAGWKERSGTVESIEVIGTN